ncbi:MAG TPA: hypothetical protein VF916_05160 [Ktedonobacterales bacterium]
MATEPLTIQVDEEAARAFKEASPEEQRKLEAIVSLQLIEATKPSTSSRNLMQTISQRARERGLTPERLQELLDEA